MNDFDRRLFWHCAKTIKELHSLNNSLKSGNKKKALVQACREIIDKLQKNKDTFEKIKFFKNSDNRVFARVVGVYGSMYGLDSSEYIPLSLYEALKNNDEHLLKKREDYFRFEGKYYSKKEFFEYNRKLISVKDNFLINNKIYPKSDYTKIVYENWDFDNDGRYRKLKTDFAVNISGFEKKLEIPENPYVKISIFTKYSTDEEFRKMCCSCFVINDKRYFCNELILNLDDFLKMKIEPNEEQKEVGRTFGQSGTCMFYVKIELLDNKKTIFNRVLRSRLKKEKVIGDREFNSFIKSLNTFKTEAGL